jgi:nucleotide-binding universal stress UspA family protein
MFRKLLVPLDGSPLAERALKPALSLARHPGVELLLLRIAYAEAFVIPELGVPGARGLAWPSQALAHAAREARDYLTSVQMAYAAPERLIWSKVISDETQSPDLAGHIIQTARDDHSDLIVISSHGRSGMQRWVYGSVAERVLSAAPCPVLALRSAASPKRVLISLDRSPLSEQALQPGLDVAHSLGCDVTLLHVIAEDAPSGVLPQHPLYHFYARQARVDVPYKSGQALEPRQRLLDQLHDEAHAYLRRLAIQQRHNGLTVHTAIEFGPPADTILEYADNHDIDLIVMATHGYTGLRRWVYGSVTNKVMRGGKHSLLIVRPPA